MLYLLITNQNKHDRWYMREEKTFKISTLEKSHDDKYNCDKFSIECSNGVRVYCSVGNWNRDWKVGDEVMADIEEKMSAKGNKYWQARCPEALKPQRGYSTQPTVNPSEVSTRFDGIEEKLNAIQMTLDTFSMRIDTLMPAKQKDEYVGDEPDFIKDL